MYVCMYIYIHHISFVTGEVPTQKHDKYWNEEKLGFFISSALVRAEEIGPFVSRWPRHLGDRLGRRRSVHHWVQAQSGRIRHGLVSKFRSTKSRRSPMVKSVAFLIEIRFFHSSLILIQTRAFSCGPGVYEGAFGLSSWSANGGD
jgi:hypothetical protein